MNYNLEEKFKQLDSYIHENRYSRHPFVKLIESNSVTKESLKRWAIQKYHQTFLQNVVHGAIHSNAMLYEDIRQLQVEQLIAEETKIADGSDAHYELMRRFAIALGATEKEIKESTPAPEVLKFVNYLVSLCKENHPVLAMLAIYVNESQTPESVMKMYRALKTKFSFSDAELEWFLVHGDVDVEHANEGKKLIMLHAKDCQDFQTRSTSIVKDGVEQWTLLQNFYASLLTTKGESYE